MKQKVKYNVWWEEQLIKIIPIFVPHKEPLRTKRYERWKGNPVRIWDNTSCCKSHSIKSLFVALFATDCISGRRDKRDKSEDLPCVLMDLYLLGNGFDINDFLIANFICIGVVNKGILYPVC